MRTKIRAAAVLSVAALVLPLTTTVGPAGAEVLACQKYRVVYGPAPVHENPDNDSVVRKYKYVGDYVTGPGRSVLDGESGIWFTAVRTSAATDGEGWMRSAQLGYPTNC